MGLRKRPHAFTEHGITTLAALLKSERAIEISVRIVDAFVAMRRYLVANGHLLPNDILPAGSEYDSLRYVSRLVESAKSEILIIDPYSDATTLDVLAKKHPGVTVRRRLQESRLADADRNCQV